MKEVDLCFFSCLPASFQDGVRNVTSKYGKFDQDM